MQVKMQNMAAWWLCQNTSRQWTAKSSSTAVYHMWLFLLRNQQQMQMFLLV